VKEFNDRQDVHGVLVQLPLPKHISENAVLQAIDPSKARIKLVAGVRAHVHLAPFVCVSKS
jgi:Tetrahydrofolate dehydrogenase/cyclohydrolase, catalytic domain